MARSFHACLRPRHSLGSSAPPTMGGSRAGGVVVQNDVLDDEIEAIRLAIRIAQKEGADSPQDLSQAANRATPAWRRRVGRRVVKWQVQ